MQVVRNRDPGQEIKVRRVLLGQLLSDYVGALRAAYREWPLFAALIDVAEMSLAKTDDRLAERLDDALSMLADGRSYLLQNPLPALSAGLAIMIAVICFNLVGDGLRDALDPTQRGRS